MQPAAEHGTTEDIAYDHRFVASADTRKMFARAFLGHVYRTRRLWIFYCLVLVLFTVLLMGDVSAATSGRLFWAIVFALVPTLIIAAWVSTVSYLKMVRGSEVAPFQRSRPGVWLRRERDGVSQPDRIGTHVLQGSQVRKRPRALCLHADAWFPRIGHVPA